MEATRRYIETGDGLCLALLDHAGPRDRSPVLCLPGLTRNERDFAALVPALAARRRVLCLNFRGRGLSDWDPRPERYAPATYAGDVLAVLDALEIRTVVLIGTSLGGLVSLLTSVGHGERLAGAVLNDIGPEVAEAGVVRIRAYVGRQATVAGWEEAAAQVRAINGDVYPDYGRADWDAMARALYREVAPGRIVPDYDPAIAKSIAAPLEDAGDLSPDLWPAFRALAARPTLAVRGQHSDILSIETFERMKAEAPSLATIEVPGRGHAPTLTEPVALAALARFLDAVA